MATPGCRILLVDDDAFIARFVAMALENEAWEFVSRATLGEAAMAVSAQRFDLLICDQMLPDGLGLDFVARLRNGEFGAKTDALTPVILFSAGIASEHLQRALDLRVAHILHKPVSVVELLRAVEATMVSAPDDPGSSAEPNGRIPPEASNPEQVCADRHFAGNVGLFLAFRTTAIEQLQTDLMRGEACMVHKQWGELGRLAHSLKTVLPMLGDDGGGAHARETEYLAHAPEPNADAIHRSWIQLRTAIKTHLAPQFRRQIR